MILRGDFLNYLWEHDGRTEQDANDGSPCDCRACKHNRTLRENVASLSSELHAQRAAVLSAQKHEFSVQYA